MSPIEDKLLVFRCKRGSKEALAQIYEKYKQDLLVLAMALLNDVSAAEDVVHDVFVSFVEAIKDFSPDQQLKKPFAHRRRKLRTQTVLGMVTMLETKKKSSNQRQSQEMKADCYLKPAWTHNGSVRSDLPLTVIGKKRKKLIKSIGAGQLFCVGKVYLKNHNGTIRIR